MMARRLLLEKSQVNDFIEVKIFISTDEVQLFVNVKYDDGNTKATREKSFKNNAIGSRDMDTFINDMTKDNGILEYFNL